ELNNRILRYNLATGALVDEFINPGPAILQKPTGMTWDANGDIYVASFNQHKVAKFDGVTGEYLGDFVTAGSGGLSGADNGITFGPDGNLYVPSYNNGRILRYDGITGAFIDTFIPNGQIFTPRVLVFNDNNELFITSEGADAVRRYNATTGEFLGNFTTPQAGGIDEPIGMVFDDEYLYVTSGSRDDVYRFDAQTGEFIDLFIDGSANGLDGPVFLTLLPEIPAPGAGTAMLVGLGLMSRRRR
ncbi:MAG: Vgb family protein, partial [Phycisphaerales bacterium]